MEQLFHATKHFEVKKMGMVKSKNGYGQITRERTSHTKPFSQYAKEHEMTTKDFNWHKSNGGVTTATTIDQIKSFKFKKANGHRAKGGPGKTCNKCSTSHLPREYPVWGKNCHKCENNHFSTCCRSKKSQQDGKNPSHPHTHGRSPLRGPKGKGRWSRSRSRSGPTTWSAHNIELNSFQDPQKLHGSHSSNVHGSQPEKLHESHSFQDPCTCTNFVKKTFITTGPSRWIA